MRAELAPTATIPPRTWLLASAAAWALAVWALGLFGLGAGIVRLPDDPSLTVRLPALPRPSPERLGPLAQYSEIGARPLFSENRRPQPFVIQTEGETEPAKANLDFVLTSVLLTPQLRMAIVQPTNGGESVRLKLGGAPEAAPGWRLIAIAPRSVIFDGPDGQRTLDLRTYDGNSGQSPTVMRPVGGGPQPPTATTMEPSPMPPPQPPAPSPAPGIVNPMPVPRPFPPNSVAEADTATTPEAQMNAIRQRIEARRAMLRREVETPVPGKNP